jgi:hypothetical protein
MYRAKVGLKWPENLWREEGLWDFDGPARERERLVGTFWIGDFLLSLLRL